MRYDAYVINLDSDTERWRLMQEEFKDTVLNLIRQPAVKDPRGGFGIGASLKNIVKSYMTVYPNFDGPLLIVLEDDLYRLQDVDTFNKRCIKIFDYLEKKRGTYSHFQGGGIHGNSFSLESEDPLLLRCQYITSSTFLVIGKAAAMSILNWKYGGRSIDDVMALDNSCSILAPYPHLVRQQLGLTKSHAGNTVYKSVQSEGTRKTQKIMADYLRTHKLNFKSMIGGRRRGRRTYKRVRPAIRSKILCHARNERTDD